MQTFLPYPDFEKSANVLDMRRLGRQRSECLQLLKGQWQNHPASKMWRGHEFQLAEYGIAICKDWIGRGYKDTCLEKITNLQLNFKNIGLPKWFGDDKFHKSHQSNLLRKDKGFYSKFFIDVPDNLPYIWPIP